MTFRSLATASLIDPNSGKGTASDPAPRVRPDTLRAIVTSPRGNATKLLVDRFGAPTRIDEPVGGRRTKINRDFASRPTRIVTPSEHTVWYTWSPKYPNLNQVRDSVTGRVVNYEYDSTRFNLLTRVHGDAPEVRHFLSASGKAVDSTTTSGGTTRFTYDARGRVLTVTDHKGHVTSFDYIVDSTNWKGNRRTVTVGSKITRFNYDPKGRPRRVTDPAGHTDTTFYDLLNRVTYAAKGNRSTQFTSEPLRTTIKTANLRRDTLCKRGRRIDALR